MGVRFVQMLRKIHLINHPDLATSVFVMIGLAGNLE